MKVFKRRMLSLVFTYGVESRLIVAAATHIYKYIVAQRGEGAQCGDDVRIGGGAKGTDCHRVVDGRGDASTLEPLRSAAGSVNLHGEGHETEQRGEGEEADADEQQAGETFKQQDAGEEYPRHEA